MSRVAHVRREGLPWRPPVELTECGRASGGLDTMSRSQWRTTWREWGQLCAAWYRARQGQPNPISRAGPPGVQRPNVCLICWETAERWPTWDEHPARAIEREINRARTGSLDRLAVELMALGVLYRQAPDAFARLVADLPDLIRSGGRP